MAVDFVVCFVSLVTIFNAIWFVCWSSNNWINLIVKFIYFAFTVAGIVILYNHFN